MKIARKFTTAGQSPFDSVEWTTRASRITNPDGSIVFEMKGAEVPSGWTQLATDIMVSKYFRKAGVPQMKREFDIIPEGWSDASADGSKVPSGVITNEDGEIVYGPERSARQVIHRLAGCWTHWGREHNYFDTEEDAQAFYDELCYMMINQMAAPNSPQWFNTGLNWAYGITGPAQGHWITDPKTGEVKLADNAYSNPQPHACFIQSVGDDLVNPGGIMDLWVREARLFKYGSGTGTNFSNLRAESEPLSGGGKSSGLMSWLKIGDRAAAAIKSGGTTRRAAKMVCLDMDHPDIESFINWKVREEIKVAAMVEGMRKIAGERASINDPETVGETAQRLGLTLDYDFNGEAYSTVSGQNSNNSVRMSDAFFDAVDRNGVWETRNRTSGGVSSSFDAAKLWDDIAYAAWRCADPGVQFDSTINAWHTCPSAGRINASNPCSEYMFLDDTACNLASLNILKFYDEKQRAFDIERYEHATDVWTVVLEISVLMASFPSQKIAELSYKYRTLGLGHANLGAALMRAGIPYDSEAGRAICAALTSILCGRSYATSAKLAKEHGPFPGYDDDRDNMLRVIRNHRRAAHGIARDSGQYESLRITPIPIDHDLFTSKVPLSNAGALAAHATKAWDKALERGEKHGFRNAQVTVIAPTGTIGLLMDCDTTGVEPDFALVKFKKLAGGGYFKIANQSVEPALVALGYEQEQVREMMTYLLGALDLHVPMTGDSTRSFYQWLTEKGFTEQALDNVTNQLPGVFELGFAFSAWGIGDETLSALGVDPEEAKADMSFSLLKELGLSSAEIDDLNQRICGTQTLEGAPHLRDEHLAVFDCANTCGAIGTRFIAPEGHIRMMGAAQSFISGAISKTINLPNDASVEDIKRCYRLSWELGIKANALYRDGCKLSQPLSTKSDKAEEEELEAAGAEAAEQVVEQAAEELVMQAVEPRARRERLPDTRHSYTHKFNVAGHEGYLTVGVYEDGRPGELFITMAKEGSTIGGLMDSLGTATSVALQYGVPLESMIRKFTHQRFEPAGMTMNSDIPFAKSLVDYIFRWLGMQFIPGYREANAPKRDSAPQETTKAGETPDSTIHNRLPSKPPRAEQASIERASTTVEVVQTETGAAVRVEESTLSVALDSAGDAPPCDVCGTITVRNGTCYKCLNCGHSMGCS